MHFWRMRIARLHVGHARRIQPLPLFLPRSELRALESRRCIQDALRGRINSVCKIDAIREERRAPWRPSAGRSWPRAAGQRERESTWGLSRHLVAGIGGHDAAWQRSTRDCKTHGRPPTPLRAPGNASTGSTHSSPLSLRADG